METDRPNDEQTDQREQPNESGLPGGGVGSREAPGHTGVYPLSASEGASPDAPVEGEMAWGQGKRGAEGYFDSGDSEALHIPPESEEAEEAE